MTSKLGLWSAAAMSVAATACISCGQTAFAQEETDQRFGTVHFATSCNETAQRRFDRAMRYQHSFWYRESKEIFEEVLKADPECGIAYWGIALSLLNNPHTPPPAPNLPLGLAAIQKAKAVGAKTAARARLHRCAAGVLYRLRQDRAWRAGAGLSQGDGGAGAAHIPTTTKRRSSTPSRSTSQPRPTTRPMPTSSRARPSWSRSSSASRGIPGVAHYLIHLYDYPALADKGPRRRQALFRDRAGRAARAAHALAHLHARRLLERIRSPPTPPRRARRRRTRSSTTSCTPWTTWSMPICSSAQDAEGAGCRRRDECDHRRQSERSRRPVCAGRQSPARYMVERGDWKGAARAAGAAEHSSPMSMR